MSPQTRRAGPDPDRPGPAQQTSAASQQHDQQHNNSLGPRGAAMPPDSSPTEVELLAEVHRVIDQVVRRVRERYGAVPAVGAGAWWAASDDARLAGLLILGEARLVQDPDRAVRERLRRMSWNLCEAMHGMSGGPSHADLLHRRYPPTGDPDLWVRWGPAGPPGASTGRVTSARTAVRRG